LTGRRARTQLAWGIRCSAMDLSRYGPGLRFVVNMCRLCSGRPDLITANSAAGLQSHLAMGYHPRRSAVVRNGIDTGAFKPDAAARAAVRRELGLAENAVVLAHVARVDPMKDHASFLRAMVQLPETHALLIGTGTGTLPDAPNISRLGPRSDMARVLA